MKLLDLLEKHDFRLYRHDLESDIKKQNTNIIRIYLDCYNWFEFGIDDWKEKEETMKNVKKILTKDILNRNVDDFQVDDGLEILVINLENKD